MESKKFQYNKSATSRDVAKLAGVSQSTVSRVFASADGKGVKEEARIRVLQAAEEIGYRPNFMARGMISGKTNIIGIVVGEGMGPFYHSILDRLIARIQEAGKQSLIFKVTRQEQLDSIILKVIQFQAEAIIITAPAMAKDIKELGVESEIPVVLFNRMIQGTDLNTVYVDSIEGGRLAAEYLCRNGHERIGYVRYTQETSEETEKAIGFSAGLRQHGVLQIAEERSDYTYEAGYEAGKRLLSGEERPTAVFCTSDLIALGVIDAAREEFRLKIPEELSVIGYDDIPMGSWKSYGLTTVRQPFGDLVDMTLRTIEEVKDGAKEPIIKMVTPELIKRNTVIACNKGMK